MVYKNFRINVSVRVGLMAIALVVFILMLLNGYYFVPVLLAFIVVYLVYSLIYYVERTNREVGNFLESIRYGDFGRTGEIATMGKSFQMLERTFDNVIRDFHKVRTEKETHYFYLQNIIQHIGIAIIAYRRDGEVEMINNAAKQLFQINHLANINSLHAWNEELTSVLTKICADEHALVKVTTSDDFLNLLVSASEFKVEDKVIKLVSIKNIQAELEENEMESWQKLIRVLTHEIMNSIAPIASLTSTVQSMVESIISEKKDVYQIDSESANDILNAVITVHNRSTGLIHFVETYRNLTRVPKPNFKIFPIKILLDNVINLFQAEFRENQIHCQTEIFPESLELTADEQLIEQVIINLVKNSIQACHSVENPVIMVKAFIDKRNKVKIQVIDNGQGILPEVIDKIFIPFFTTKPKGSGIGLSLTKQILRLHSGNINVTSIPNVNTTFTISF